MANNDMKPIFSSSEDEDDEETSGSESDEVSDTDPDKKQSQEPKKPLIAPPQSANLQIYRKPPDLSSSETEESGSDSDTDTDPPTKKSAVVDRNVKANASKSVGTNVESKRITTPPPANGKRPPSAPTVNEKDVKKALVGSSQHANKPQAPDFSSTEESESDTYTDTDSDSPPGKSTVADSKVRPISSKPMEREGANVESKLGKKDGSKTISTTPPVKSKRPSPAPTADENNAKKAKQKTVNGEPKKALVGPSQSANRSQAPDQSSSATEESGDDTDTDSPPKKSNGVDPNIKTTSSKWPKKSNVVDTHIKPMAPMEREGSNIESNLAKNDASRTKGKRPPPAPMANEEDAKKAKKSTATDDDSKKQLFQRLWSEDDEIVILKGMIDYKTERNGENPITDTGAFYEFIKKSLHVDVSRSQLVDKIRRLKKKYVNNASREKDGKERSFSKSHEQKGYELSKLIWGSDSNNNNMNKHNNGTEIKTNQSQKNDNQKGIASTLMASNGVDDKEKSTKEVDKNIDISRFVHYGGRNNSLILPEEFMKAGMELVDESRRAEMEEKWRKFKEQELVLYVKQLELLREQALLVIEAIKSSGN